MTQLQLKYRPPGAVLRSFLRDDTSFFRGLMGPFGSGKSTGCVVDVIRRAQLQRPGIDGVRRSRWAVVRNTYPELRTTTIKTWHQWIPQTIGRWIDQGPPTHRITTPDMDLEVMFIALDRPDDVGRLLSLELTGAWINEAREIPLAVVEGLTARVGRFPSAAMGGTSWSGIIADTNPPDSDHWWFKLAEETKPEGYTFYRQPGGMDDAAENLAWLNQTPETLVLDEADPIRRTAGQGYYRRLLAGKSEEWVSVYVDGQYGFVRDGKPVYPEFSDRAHCAEFELLEAQPIYVGIDFGLTPAATFAQRTVTGQWRVHSELVSRDMGAVRFGELLRRHLSDMYPRNPIAAITGDPAGDIRSQSDESTPFLMLRAQGIDAQPANTNDPVIRREAVAGAMSRMIDGQPGLLINPHCRVLRKALAGGYHYRRVQVSGDARYRDVPEKNDYSHVAEAMQYMMLGAGEGRSLIRTERKYAPRQSSAILEYDF